MKVSTRSIARRIFAILAAFSIAVMGLVGTSAPARAQSFSNVGVADAGLAELGTSRPTGWNQPGECIKSVQRWVAAAGGYFGPGGIVSGYVNSGAQEVSLSTATKGDVIQYTNGNASVANTDWSYVHTVVIITNHGNGKFDIVQSNSPAGSGLVTRVSNWVPSPHAGWVARVWRFGTVQASPPPPAPDSDGDSVSDNKDSCPTIVGVGSNRGCRQEDHTVSGNFYGNDSYTDTVTFYDYGSDNLGLLLSKGGAEGLDRPLSIWNTGQGQWNWGKSKFLAGNFAGDDAYTDVIGLYDYGSSKLGVFLFRGNGNGVLQPQLLWTTSSDTWSLGRAKYVVGNFSGNDNKDDIMAFYSYADSSQGVFVFPGSSNGVGQVRHQWSSGPQQWNVGSAEYVTGNFAGSDEFTDVVAFYQYGGDSMGAFLFQGTGANIGQPQNLWSTGQGAWNNRSAQFFAGDFYGNDSVTDVVALYDLGNANMGAYVFPGSSSGIGQFQKLWTTGADQWYASNTKAVAGRFSGSASSLFAWYNYGSSNTGGKLLSPSTTGGVEEPVSRWTTGVNQLNWLCM